jgi:1-acyl-sn-glycerol-3-phosphate acyltransferase
LQCIKRYGRIKPAAFSVAVKAGVPEVPITLIGTGEAFMKQMDRAANTDSSGVLSG